MSSEVGAADVDNQGRARVRSSTEETTTMLSLSITLQNLIADRVEQSKDRGATAVEYALMVALIAAVIIAAVTVVGTSLRAVFNGFAPALTAVVP